MWNYCQTIIFECVLFLGHLLNQFDDFCKSHPLLQSMITNIRNLTTCIYALSIRMKIESNMTAWTQYCFSMYDETTQSYRYIEFNEYPTVENSNMICVEKCQTTDETAHDIYKIQLMKNRSITMPPTFEASNIHFLSIEYIHPSMTEKLDITVPVSHCMVGNEILSLSYVFRLLNYQSHSFVFDTGYTLAIMDNNIQIFELKANQYLKIHKDNYTIMTEEDEMADDTNPLENTYDILYTNENDFIQ